MRRSKTQSFGELLQEYLDAIDVHHKRREAKVITAWPEVVGQAVMNRTAGLEIRRRVLYVSMNSSVARSELVMIREGLLKALNDKAGAKVIDDIVIR